jgi:diguanylate cyclase (GGDEF)-like protein
MSYYSAIGVLAAMILLIENCDLLFYRSEAFEGPTWRIFRRFLWSVFVFYLTDILWGTFEQAKMPVALFVDTTAYFIALATSIAYWTRYAVAYINDNSTFSRVLHVSGRTVATAITCIALVNCVYPVLFIVDEHCVYQALPLRSVLLVVEMALLALVSFHMMICFLRTHTTAPDPDSPHAQTDAPAPISARQRYRTLTLFGTVMVVCIAAQLYDPYLPFYTIAFMLSTCLLRAFVIGDEKRAWLEERKREERAAYSRINALIGELVCVYTVDPVTDHYREHSSSEAYDRYQLDKEGDDFFGSTLYNIRQLAHPDDLPRVVAQFSKEEVLAQIERSGIFAMNYRLALGSRYKYIQLKAALVEEGSRPVLVVGVINVDAQVRREEEFARGLAQARAQASIDALTGMKNRHAFLETEAALDREIMGGRRPEFAIVMMDLNDLKLVNDQQGHAAGDQYLRDACAMMCGVFDKDQIYRVGGDEFVAVVRGEELARLEELVGRMADHNAEALQTGGIVIACGAATYADEPYVATVFEIADQRMYANKEQLKSRA